MATNLRHLSAALAEFQKFGRDMQSQTMQIFLAVAVNDGLTFREISQRTGFSISSISRNLETLEGHGLLVRKTDPDDARSKRGVMTADGKHFAEALIAKLNGATL